MGLSSLVQFERSANTFTDIVVSCAASSEAELCPVAATTALGYAAQRGSN